jgi:hypothetical protein
MRKLDEKDWIIARLTYALYEEGRNSTHPDAIKTVKWFGHKRLLAAWSELSGSKDKVPRYSAYWNKDGWSI